MTDKIDEIRARCEAATPGKWEADYNTPFSTDVTGIMADEGYVILADGGFDDEYPREEDAEFIAHAREDIPYLIELLAEQDAEIKRLKIAAFLV